MSSRSSSTYGSSSTQDKGAYVRPSSSRSSASTASYSSSGSAAYSSSSSRGYRSKNYKPPVIHNGGGQTNDPNTSTSAPNAGYYN
ncbi:uncharacterized protein EI97DRAFT_455629 [Westerdykella ornata]|uniref:Uncharacterized protein n=1 Tax=Westerdykella ornata TaxID=318751 RepID=A0A6A6JTD3_WESOR|nr:uncharacterized protein EI97DRAFT_455629 [Westerdykella ornata]KAF2279373.1 hypothetical protein EI97DRAFT_455629 [Westerdykella ornata]